jgi:hypothetical protein
MTVAAMGSASRARWKATPEGPVGWAPGGTDSA